MADYLYGLPKEDPTPLPSPLRIALDWTRFHTPYHAGGLIDQPIQLMRAVRSAWNAYNAINAYRDAQHRLPSESLGKWYAANHEIVKFMEYVWKLQEDAADFHGE